MYGIIIHYGEIGLKGRNRNLFEKRLADSVKDALAGFPEVKRVRRLYGRIVCETEGTPDTNAMAEALRFIPGIVYFFFAERTGLELSDIAEAAVSMLQGKEFSTFRVDSKRPNKLFPKTSQELNAFLGEKIVETFGKKVDLKHPELTLRAEVCDEDVFLYTERVEGIGGLPSGISGIVLASLSGGIDSPVASYLLMKRGCTVVFVHIFNKTIAGEAVLSKIDSLVQELTKVQLKSKLYIVPFAELQKRLIAAVPAKYRMIVYRRFMMRILSEIARKENAKAIVTGDSIGQVASQTLQNIACIYDASLLPVLNPLSGMNKDEIVQIAERIGTYQYSIQKYPDCCSFMVAESPETKGNIRMIGRIESGIPDVMQIVQQCVEKSEIRTFERKP